MLQRSKSSYEENGFVANYYVLQIVISISDYINDIIFTFDTTALMIL